jgi:hypothetical protein
MSLPLPHLPQAFSINYDGISNRIISDITFFEHFNPVTPPSALKSHKTTALWDTGATGSIITRSTAEALNLTPIGKVMINHGGGQSEHLTHLINIGLPNRVLVEGIIVTEMEHIVDNFGVIIGMDIIASGDFSLTNPNGKTCFSFRFPSLSKVDYVEEIDNKMKKIRGHDQCPCKSGKQYRKCHGRQAG